jgi:hypothetical protein
MSESIEYAILKSKDLNIVHKFHNSYIKFDYCYEMKCGAIFHSYFSAKNNDYNNNPDKSLRINSSNSNSKIQLFGQEFELDFIRDINEIDSNIKKCPYCFCNER